VAFPSPSLAPPALNAWQLSYGGLVFGGIVHGSPYSLQSLTIDMPDVATGDVQRALDHGEFIGLDTLPGADLTIVQTVISDGVSLDHAAQQLGGVFAPGGVTEQPLWLQTPAGTFARMCRARKHNCPIDINRVMAGVTVATTLLHSTDPRWYAAPSLSQTVGLPTSIGGGLPVPPAVPWALGGGSVGGLVNVVNSGLFEMRPVLVITGPCINPVVANLSILGAPWVGVTQTLNAGDTLVIDLDWQSVVYTTAGSSIGASRRNALTYGSTWWNLPPGSSTIEFTSADTSPVTGTLTVNSASAYLSL
jgi:hypothetical protein